MEEFTNEQIDLNLLPQYQEVNLNAPDPRYWKVILINISMLFAICTIGLTASILLVTDFRPYKWYGVGGVTLVFLCIYLLHKASFKKRGYALREKDIIYKSGIIAESTSIIPLNRIQHVALDEGMFSRMYQLATLQIHTAGGPTGHMHIAGIPVEQAKAIKEVLLKKIDILETSANEDE